MNERRRRRALITRPQEDSADVAIALARRGITPVLAPMMRIAYAPVEIENEVGLAQAVLFTSRNGVRAFTRLSPRRDMPAFAVGDSTASLARDNGFTQVESAKGDSSDLARLVIARLKPEAGLVFHAAGATVGGDLAETLNKSGFNVVRQALYEAKPVPELDNETATALRDRTLDYVLFFSPRTGRIFAERVAAAGLDHTCDSLTAICLSEAVANEVTDLPWKDRLVAATPTTEALISVLGELENGAAQTAATETGESELPDQSAGLKATPEDLIERAVETTAAAGRTGEPPEAVPDEIPAEIPTETPAIEAPMAPSPEPPSEPSPALQTESAVEPESSGPAETPAKTPEKASAGSAPETRKASVAGALPMAAGIAAAVLAAAYLTLPMWRDHLPPQARERLAGSQAATKALRAENSELKIRIDDLDKILITANGEIAATRKKAGDEITALKSQLAASEQAADRFRAEAEAARKAAGDNAALAARVSGLEKEIAAANTARAAAEKQMRQARDAHSAVSRQAKSAAAEMSAKIVALEKQVADARAAVLSAGKADTVALAAGKLRDALAHAAPFASEIAALKRLGSANPDIVAAIGQIEVFAAKGVPRRSALFARLPATVTAAMEAARNPPGTGWIGRVTAKLGGFVTIRRIDGKGEGVEAVLARAEIAAKNGDLTAAVNHISTLTGSAAMAASPWLSAAQARLAAEKASAALDRIVLTAFAKRANTSGDGQ